MFGVFLLFFLNIKGVIGFYQWCVCFAGFIAIGVFWEFLFQIKIGYAAVPPWEIEKSHQMPCESMILFTVRDIATVRMNYNSYFLFCGKSPRTRYTMSPLNHGLKHALLIWHVFILIWHVFIRLCMGHLIRLDLALVLGRGANLPDQPKDFSIHMKWTISIFLASICTHPDTHRILYI